MDVVDEADVDDKGKAGMAEEGQTRERYLKQEKDAEGSCGHGPPSSPRRSPRLPRLPMLALAPAHLLCPDMRLFILPHPRPQAS